MNQSEWKLITFDLDGTLIPEISSAEHLADRMGNLEETRKYENLYTTGEITGLEFADFDCSKFKGHVKEDIVKHLESIPIIDDIEETIEILATKNIPCAICTLAWTFISESIALRYGIPNWSGASLETDQRGYFTGNVVEYFHAEDKVSYVQSLCDSQGISISEVVHIGDSTSDLHLFDAVGYSIALNGTPHAVERANISINSCSLLDVLAAIPRL